MNIIYIKKRRNPQLWTPEKLANYLKGWYDASDTTTLYDSISGGNQVTTNSSDVFRWENKANPSSGKLPNITGGDGTGPSPYENLIRKNALVTNFYNGLSALRGTGNRCLRILGTFTKVFPSVFYIVSTPQSSVSRAWIATLQNPGGSDAPVGCINQILYTSPISALKHFYRNASGTNIYLNSTSYPSGTSVENTKIMVGVRYRSDGTDFVVNGAIEASGTEQQSTQQGIQIIHELGSRIDLNCPTSVRNCEIVLSTDTSSDSCQKIEGYLAHKWGLTSNLPNDHPYKSNPPLV